MEISFLSASDGRALTKKFTKRRGVIEKESYPHVARFTSSTADPKTLTAFAKALTTAANRGECLSKSLLTREITNESRAGTTDRDLVTQFMVLDLDKMTGFKSIDEFLDVLGLSNVSYILQYSASQNIFEKTTMNAHLFIMLNKPVSPHLIKLWIMQQNLTIPVLRNQMRLTKSNNALLWPLDRSVNQNDKLLYITKPELYGGLKDPFPTNRITVIKRANQTADVSIFEEVSVDSVEAEQLMRLNILRKEAGLPTKRKIATKTHKGEVVMSAPSKVNITDTKEDRGFIYFNFNGGDSWGYYTSKANPEVVKNFKGEDNYALKDIAPEMYKKLSKEAFTYVRELEAQALVKKVQGLSYIAFLDPISDQYFKCTYDHEEDTHNTLATSSILKLQHFLKQNEAFVPDFIPEWRYHFDFESDIVFDPASKTINRYQRSSYIRELDENCKHVTRPSAFRTINRVIGNVCGDNNEAIAHFTNWLAYIIQYRRPPRTAWLLHGIQGTGKGVLFNHILAPLVGRKYVQIRRLEELEEGFNAFMEECIFLFIDEISISDAKHRSRIMAKIKNFIVEPTISIRGMRANSYMAPNHMSILLGSNKPDPIEIDPTDRRINVADYQLKKLIMTDTDIANLYKELPAFAQYLNDYEVDEVAARTPMESDAKEHIKFLTRNSVDLMTDALKAGDVEFFFTAVNPNISQDVLEMQEATEHQKYKNIVHAMFCAVRDKDIQFKLTREDLMFITEYLIGNSPESKHKFTNFIKHHGIDIVPIKVEGKTIRGINMKNIHVAPSLSKEWFKEWATRPSKITKLKAVK